LSGAIQELYPKVSIAILTYNNLDYTKICLESVFNRTSYLNYEVIVVDNASTDGTQEYLRVLADKEEKLRIILNNENVGFASGNNQAAKIAEGKYLILLNNDTVVPHGWVSRLLKYLRDPSIGMVGPVTNWSGNESKIIVNYDTIDGMDAFAQQRAYEQSGVVFDIRVAALFCAALRRDEYLDLGGLDERYTIGMFEDDDFAEKVRRSGKRVVCTEEAFVHHWGKASFSKLDKQTYMTIFEENKNKFEQKWGIKWCPHQYREGVS
jgi:GT2 family glycosyltransferase